MNWNKITDKLPKFTSIKRNKLYTDIYAFSNDETIVKSSNEVLTVDTIGKYRVATYKENTLLSGGDIITKVSSGWFCDGVNIKNIIAWVNIPEYN